MKWQIPIGLAWACFGAGFGYWAASPSADLTECRETLTYCIDKSRGYAATSQTNWDGLVECSMERDRVSMRLGDIESDLYECRLQAKDVKRRMQDLHRKVTGAP
jgi:hypothetical protein